MNPVSLQWALNETAGVTISVSKGLIKAASSDNIQALALIVCEAFGATLAMCQETCMKVERIAGMHHESRAVKFLKSQIGYSSGDSGAQLSLSGAGVRFLGLAAALSTLGTFRGAVALESMIADSAGNHQFLPTVHQLNDLLVALDYKLGRAGFTENLAGWHIWFANHPLLLETERILLATTPKAPSPEALNQLVKALRELARLGDLVQVTVSLGHSALAPWVTAFVKWSLGMPPSIILTNGATLLEQPGSQVALILFPEWENLDKIEVKIVRELDKPAEIVHAPLNLGSWTGMVSVRTYAQYKLQQMGMQSGLAERAICQALPFAVKQAKSLLQPDSYLDETDLRGLGRPDWKTFLHNLEIFDTDLRRKLPEEFADLAGDMFPEDHVISSALSEFMGTDVGMSLSVLRDGTLITDLPLVALYQDSVKSRCTCAECGGESAPTYQPCSWKGTLMNMSNLVADILALSLLDCAEPVLVYVKSSFDQTEQYSLRRSVYSVLSEGKPRACCVENVIGWALGLVGHDVSHSALESWVMSSHRGQAFYPRLFETETLGKRGLLVMSGAAGVLRYDGQVYTRAISHQSEQVVLLSEPNQDIRSRSATPVEGPLNLFGDHSIKWQITVGDKLLYVSILSTASRAIFAPFAILFAAVHSLYVEECSHCPDAPLSKPDHFAAYTSPFFPWGGGGVVGNQQGTKLGVVAVHGNERLRMFCLARGLPAVVQLNSCLQCCLDVCRKADYQFVIDGGLQSSGICRPL